MSEHPPNNARLFITDGDITALPCFANDTIFAVRAPQGTTLEVPDPEDGLDARGQRRYRCAGSRCRRCGAGVALLWCWNGAGACAEQALLEPGAAVVWGRGAARRARLPPRPQPTAPAARPPRRIILRSRSGPVDVYLVQHPQAADGAAAAAAGGAPGADQAAGAPGGQPAKDEQQGAAAAAGPAGLAAAQPAAPGGYRGPLISPLQHTGVKQEPGLPNGISPRPGLPTPIGFGHFGLHSPGAFTPGGLVSPGLHRMMEIDPDNWFADAQEQPQGGYTLGEFFKDDSSIFNEPEDQGGVFA
jgi:transcription factor E2F3